MSDPSSGLHGSGLFESVKRNGGVQQWYDHNPHNTFENQPGKAYGSPELHAANDGTGFVQGQGHHRMAAAAQLQRETGKTQWTPVQYTDVRVRASRDDAPPVKSATAPQMGAQFVRPSYKGRG